MVMSNERARKSSRYDRFIWRGFREWRFFNGGEPRAVRPPPPPPTELLVHGTAHRSWNNASSDIWFFFFFFEPARRPPTGRGGYRLPFKARFKIESILNRGSKFKFRIQYFHGIHQFK